MMRSSGTARSRIVAGMLAIFGSLAATAQSPPPPGVDSRQTPLPGTRLPVSCFQARHSFTLPDTVVGYVLGKSAPVEGSPESTAYSYENGSTGWITVFIYPRQIRGRSADSRTALTEEGRGLFEMLPVGVQRGRWDDYVESHSAPDSVMVNGGVTLGNETAAVTKLRGAVSVQMQYVYLLGSHFVKVRATVPSDDWEKSGVPAFASALIARLAAQ